MINNLLKVFLCLVFLPIDCLLTRSAGLSKYRTTSKGTQHFYIPKRLMTFIYFTACYTFSFIPIFVTKH